MSKRFPIALTVGASILLVACTPRKPIAPPPPAPAAQQHSPMSDSTRRHERIASRTFTDRVMIEGVLPRPVEFWFPRDAPQEIDVVIHFHGAAYVPFTAAERHNIATAAVNLGAGSRRYEEPFLESRLFPDLLSKLEELSQRRIAKVYLSGFSAGYGSIRAILRNHSQRIGGVLLLDGLHASYIPERKPLADGGKLDSSSLEMFAAFAARAAQGQTRMMVTHSEIFPGTFASTTETADYLLSALDLKREPVLQWGPLGMQQLSEARRGRFLLLGFAGNTAPDHLDHLHALPEMVRLLLER